MVQSSSSSIDPSDDRALAILVALTSDRLEPPIDCRAEEPAVSIREFEMWF